MFIKQANVMDKPGSCAVMFPIEATDLDCLARMQSPDLQRLYSELLGCSPRDRNSEHARREIAWHLQTAKEGGLPESARQHALAIARDVRLRISSKPRPVQPSGHAPVKHAATSRIVVDHDSRLPMPGCLLVRAYKGRQIVCQGSQFRIRI